MFWMAEQCSECQNNVLSTRTTLWIPGQCSECQNNVLNARTILLYSRGLIFQYRNTQNAWQNIPLQVVTFNRHQNVPGTDECWLSFANLSGINDTTQGRIQCARTRWPSHMQKKDVGFYKEPCVIYHARVTDRECAGQILERNTIWKR